MRIKYKLILLIGLLTGLIILALLMVISKTVKADVEKEVLSNFEQQQQSLQQLQFLVYDRLVESCLLIGQNAAFKANVSLGDAPTVREAVAEFADMVKVDLLMVTDAKGKILSALDAPEKTGMFINNWPGIAESLAGIYPEVAFKTPIFWKQEDHLFQVVSLPISTQSELLGTISLGIALTDYEAAQLQLNENLGVHFVLENQIIASTLPLENRSSLTNVLSNFAGQYPLQPQIVQFSTGKHYVSFAQLGETSSAWLMCSTPQSVAMQLLYQIESKIWWIGLGSFLVIALLSIFISHQISRPILKVVRALNLVQKGDLTTQLLVTSNDEIGELALAFNQMTQGLKERLRLRKYVGEHTRALVANESMDRTKRMDACVLFSDIRGFTQLSETMEPEVVVELLNTWLGFQADIVRQHQGIIDKFIGDEMMAIFLGDSAIQQAINCALAIQQQAAQVGNATSSTVTLGIGINYGKMVMGSIGITDRKDHTVIGATVNLASRLCGKAVGGAVLIPVDVLQLIEYPYAKSEVQSLHIKGIKKQVDVINLTGVNKD